MTALADTRDRTIRDHMRLETELDFEAVLKTFAHPRYEFSARAPCHLRR